MSYEFTYDWQSNNFPIWDKILMPHKDRIKDILEIGCFEGMASVWLLEHFPKAHLHAIDTFEGDSDLKDNKVDFSKVRERWFENVHFAEKRSHLWSKRSDFVLPYLIHIDQTKYDLILVDGDHSAPAVLFDLVLSWMLLRKDGIMIIDDYEWGGRRPEHETPKPAVDAFICCYVEQYRILHEGYQVIVQKL